MRRSSTGVDASSCALEISVCGGTGDCLASALCDMRMVDGDEETSMGVFAVYKKVRVCALTVRVLESC